MREAIQANPLQWPTGWKRTSVTARSAFKCNFSTVRDRILKELDLMGIGDWNVIISSNVELRRDGLPYAGRREPNDRGVAVYWFDGDKRRVIACDRWDRVRDNMRAIQKTLDAMRGLDRWGTSEIMDRVFDGFNALPPAGDETPTETPIDLWRKVLGFVIPGERVDMDILRARWIELCRKHHPDHGGDDKKMKLINHAYHAAQNELRASAS